MRFDLARRRAPGSLATGGAVLAGVAVAGLAGAWHLGLDPARLAPGPGGLALVGEFFGRMFRPALAFEGGYADGGPLAVPAQALCAAAWTVAFAAAAISLAVPAGLVLGTLGARAPWGRRAARWTVPARLLAAGLRSVHELIWAVLLLAALGTDRLVAVAAIALPYTGVLAKVFAEMIDETPGDAAVAQRHAGASSLQAFAWGLLPRALPDLAAYAFYRFECALRSSAVLGFFGFPTLGYHLAASFENLHYGEVWTYLWVLFALVAAGDWWSGRMRRELGA